MLISGPPPLIDDSTGIIDYYRSTGLFKQGGRDNHRTPFMRSYLDRLGIRRSNGQINSHFKVLRNMLKESGYLFASLLSHFLTKEYMQYTNIWSRMQPTSRSLVELGITMI